MLFTIAAKKLLNSLAIIEFDVNRRREIKNWCFQLFLLLEIETWQTESNFEDYFPSTAVSSFPRPTQRFNESAFIFTNINLNTSGHKLTLPFIKVLPQTLL